MLTYFLTYLNVMMMTTTTTTTTIIIIIIIIIINHVENSVCDYRHSSSVMYII